MVQIYIQMGISNVDTKLAKMMFRVNPTQSISKLILLQKPSWFKYFLIFKKSLSLEMIQYLKKKYRVTNVWNE